MPELIHEHSVTVTADDGVRYRARVYGEQRREGTWSGFIEFVPADGARGAATLRTGQETSQPDRKAVEYWAGGLEPVYLEGALSRARQTAGGVPRG